MVLFISIILIEHCVPWSGAIIKGQDLKQQWSDIQIILGRGFALFILICFDELNVNWWLYNLTFIFKWKCYLIVHLMTWNNNESTISNLSSGTNFFKCE